MCSGCTSSIWISSDCGIRFCRSACFVGGRQRTIIGYMTSFIAVPADRNTSLASGRGWSPLIVDSCIHKLFGGRRLHCCVGTFHQFLLFASYLLGVQETLDVLSYIIHQTRSESILWFLILIVKYLAQLSISHTLHQALLHFSTSALLYPVSQPQLLASPSGVVLPAGPRSLQSPHLGSDSGTENCSWHALPSSLPHIFA